MRVDDNWCKQFLCFRVTAVCGDFYIGGRQFDSLQDLIGYYTHISDLLKHERWERHLEFEVNVRKKLRSYFLKILTSFWHIGKIGIGTQGRS